MTSKKVTVVVLFLFQKFTKINNTPHLFIAVNPKVMSTDGSMHFFPWVFHGQWPMLFGWIDWFPPPRGKER